MTEPEKKRGCFFYGCIFSLVGVGVIAAAGVGIFMYGKSVVDPVAATFLEHVDKSEYTEAYAMLGDGWKKQMDQPQFTAFEKAIQSNLGTCQSRTMTGVFINSNGGTSNATAVYSAQFAKGAATLTFTFIKENGDWKVQGLLYNSPLLVGKSIPGVNGGAPITTATSITTTTATSTGTNAKTPASGVGSGATDDTFDAGDKTEKSDKSDQPAKTEKGD